jgi:tRNA-2-methylthio-N6-dimethylallyladenosine synthase
MTSHPKDLSDKLIQAMAEVPEVCPMLHLPVQSGSDRILGLMNRQYTRQHYVEKIQMVRETVPDIALSTDVLVGFPGETEQDFRETMDLLEEVRFHGVFSFRYSIREGTAAAKFPDDVPESLKIARLETVIERQREISHELNESRLGMTVKVLVEAPAKKGQGYLMGRSPRDEVVVFPADGVQVGDICDVKIDDVRGFTLVGELV